jgi:hypothetical protein
MLTKRREGKDVLAADVREGRDSPDRKDPVPASPATVRALHRCHGQGQAHVVVASPGPRESG